MSRDLLDLVRELNTLNDDNLADRVIANSDVQWCLSELQDILEEMPTLTQPNEPLTLEQLREMDGEPVWVTPLGFWALVIAKPGKRVRLISNDGETVWADKEIELVGPIYRRPLERQEDT